MTLEEQLKEKEMELKELEGDLFILECKDHFNQDDWDEKWSLERRIRNLRKEIKDGRI